MNHLLHRAVDGVSAVVLVGFLALEYGIGGANPVPERAMSIGDAGLHALIFGTIAWHIINERFGGHKHSKTCEDTPLGIE
jgi:hypothetical protein